MSHIPAPLLSRHVGVIVVVLSVVAAAALLAAPFLGYWPLVAAIVLIAIQQVFLALAIVLIGRTGLAGRHRPFAVLTTLGSGGVLVLDALAEVVGVLLANVGPLPSLQLVTPVAIGLVALTASLLVLFGIAVLRAGVVRPGVRVLPLVTGVAVLAAGVVVAFAPLPTLTVAPALAVLLSGGIGLALRTPRTLS